jgi:biotin carboxylase
MTTMEIKRVILLMRVSTYRAEPFRQAAEKLRIELVPGIDIHPELAEYWQVQLPVQFNQPEEAVKTILAFAQEKPVQAILAVDDSAAVIAAQASEALGLVHNSSQAALAARNKYEMRRLFAAGGVASPHFKLYEATDNPAQIAAETRYPCVRQ